MSSPQLLAFSQFIKIDRRKSDPVYLQIVYQLIKAIQLGILEDGDQLPGSRPLSGELNIHRKTLVKALEELQLQGWVRSEPSVGRFVVHPEQKKKQRGISASFPANAIFSFRRSFILDSSQESDDVPLRFSDGTPDYRIIDPREIGRFYSSVVKRRNGRHKKSPASDHSYFKEQLRFYLNTTRGFHSSEKNILTTRKKSVLLYVVAQLLLRSGDQVLVSHYSTPIANMVFQQAGAQLRTVPMDDQGIQTDFIRQHFKKSEIRLLYLQPQHHYPTTTCLSASRYQELIELSQDLDFLILEDESFFEWTYDKSYPPPLIKRHHGGRLLYLGAFGGFLLPGFQTHYLLGPGDFIAEAHKYRSLFNEADPIKERALGEIIYEGDIHRYRRKSLRIYHARRDLFNRYLEHYFPTYFTYTPPRGGLAFWLSVKSPGSLSEIAEKCRQKGVFIPRICQYQNREEAALRLGFGNLNEKEMQEAMILLRESMDELMG